MSGAALTSVSPRNAITTLSGAPLRGGRDGVGRREPPGREPEHDHAFDEGHGVFGDVRERLHPEAAALQNAERERRHDDAERIELADERDRDRDEAVARRELDVEPV